MIFEETDVLDEVKRSGVTQTGPPIIVGKRSPRKRLIPGLVEVLSSFSEQGDASSSSALMDIDVHMDLGQTTLPVVQNTANSSSRVGVHGELINAISLLNTFMGADTDPIENLVSCMKQSVTNAIIPTKEPHQPKEIYEDPIEKRMRFREYKVTDANPIPWSRDFGFPNFKAQILTVVASVSLAVDLDLKRIAERARNVEYYPKRFASLIMRIRNPKSVALIFSSGKMVVAGTKTEAECKKAVRKYARVIEGIGYRVSIVNFEIQNISASGNFKFGVRVHDMAQDDGIKMFVSYEAEIFPGLVYTLVKPKVKAIIFVTGAILMTGAKSEAEIQEALETIYPIVRKHRR